MLYSRPRVHRRPAPETLSPESTLRESLDQKPRKLAGNKAQCWGGSREEGTEGQKKKKKKYTSCHLHCSIYSEGISLHCASYIYLDTGDTAQISQTQERGICYKNPQRNPSEIQKQEPQHSWASWNLGNHKEWKLLSQGLPLSRFQCLYILLICFLLTRVLLLVMVHINPVQFNLDYDF